jgi:spore germination cell wall hydrolase CwlJ-like protein
MIKGAGTSALRGRLVAIAILVGLVGLTGGAGYLAFAPDADAGAPQLPDLSKLPPQQSGPEIPDNPIELLFGTETPDWNLADFNIEETINDPAVYQDASASEAQTINQQLPFSTAPRTPAPPFFLRAENPNQRARAVHCLALAVYYEAKSEPFIGQQAVAQVVLNRVRHPAWPHSVCGVVFQGSERRTGCQFTFTCDGSLARPPSGRSWSIAQGIAFSALSGHVVPEVGLATHYHADYVAPRWAPSLTKLAKIGVHIFYTWQGRGGTIAAFRERHSGREAWPRKAAASEPSLGPADALADGVDPAAVAAAALAPVVPGAEGSVAGNAGASVVGGAGLPRMPEAAVGLGETGVAGGNARMGAASGRSPGAEADRQTVIPRVVVPSPYASGLPPEPDLESLVPSRPSLAVTEPSTETPRTPETRAAPAPMMRKTDQSRALDGL